MIKYYLTMTKIKIYKNILFLNTGVYRLDDRRQFFRSRSQFNLVIGNTCRQIYDTLLKLFYKHPLSTAKNGDIGKNSNR